MTNEETRFAAAKEDGVFVSEAVFEHYLETCSAASAPEIAARLGWSESKVRQVINDLAGAPRDCVAKQEQKPRYSRNYRAQVVGYSKVWCYEPTKSLLREHLLRALGRADPLDKKGES